MSGHAASAEATSFGGSEGSGHGNAAIVVEDAVDRRGSHAPARSSSLDNILREKTITPIGGIALLFNNMTGIGLTQTSQTYQHSGWVVTTIFFVVYMVISTLCALFIVEAMQGIPGNKYFQGTVEFGTLINFYFGPTAHIFGQICLFGALQGNAVASIIQSAQTVDNLLVDVFGKTCAVSARLTWICVTERQVSLSPFGDIKIIVSIGFLVVLFCVVPMCLFPLADYVWVQIVSFVCTLGIFCQWMFASAVEGLQPARVPPIGQPSGFAGLIGVVMLNYAFVQTVPAWVNCKRPNVNVQKSLWTATGIGLASYVVTGVIPALAFDIPSYSNLLAVMASKSTANKVFGYIFSVLVLMTSIPVMVVISHMNLTQNLNINRYFGVALCYVLPWLVSLPFQTGSWLLRVTVWSSLIFVSTANFIVPLCIYLKAAQFRRAYNKKRVLSEKQRNLLRIIHSSSSQIHRHLNDQERYHQHHHHTPTHTTGFSGFFPRRRPSSQGPAGGPPPSPHFSALRIPKNSDATGTNQWLTAKDSATSPTAEGPSLGLGLTSGQAPRGGGGGGSFLTVPVMDERSHSPSSSSMQIAVFDSFRFRPPSIRSALTSFSNYFTGGRRDSFAPSVQGGIVPPSAEADSGYRHHEGLTHSDHGTHVVGSPRQNARGSIHVPTSPVDPSINPMLADADPKLEHYLFEDVPDPEAEQDIMKSILAIPNDEETAPRGRARWRRQEAPSNAMPRLGSGEDNYEDGLREQHQKHQAFLDTLFAGNGREKSKGKKGRSPRWGSRSRSPGSGISWLSGHIRSATSASSSSTPSRMKKSGRDDDEGPSSPLLREPLPSEGPEGAQRGDFLVSTQALASSGVAARVGDASCVFPSGVSLAGAAKLSPTPQRQQQVDIPTLLISSVDDLSPRGSADDTFDGYASPDIWPSRDLCESPAPHMHEDDFDEGLHEDISYAPVVGHSVYISPTSDTDTLTALAALRDNVYRRDFDVMPVTGTSVGRNEPSFLSPDGVPRLTSPQASGSAASAASTVPLHHRTWDVPFLSDTPATTPETSNPRTNIEPVTAVPAFNVVTGSPPPLLSTLVVETSNAGVSGEGLHPHYSRKQPNHPADEDNVQVMPSISSTSTDGLRRRASFSRKHPDTPYFEAGAIASSSSHPAPINVHAIPRSHSPRPSSPPLNEAFVAVASVAPAFRSIPRWIPVQPRAIAIVCLVVAGLTTLVNIVYNVGGWGAGDLGESYGA